MNTFFVKVLASDRKFFEGQAQIVVTHSKRGEAGFMAHHEDSILALEMGQIRITDGSGKKIIFLAGPGIMQFINNRMMILTEFAEFPEDIDAKRAQMAKDRAEERMRQQQSIAEFHASRASLARAIARLKETSKYNNLGE